MHTENLLVLLIASHQVVVVFLGCGGTAYISSSLRAYYTLLKCNALVRTFKQALVWFVAHAC